MTTERPDLAALWGMESRIVGGVFDKHPFADFLPREADAPVRFADEPTIAELKAGNFDAGLAPQSFQEDLAGLLPIPKVTPVIRLINAEAFPQSPMKTRLAGPLPWI